MQLTWLYIYIRSLYFRYRFRVSLYKCHRLWNMAWLGLCRYRIHQQWWGGRLVSIVNWLEKGWGLLRETGGRKWLGYICTLSRFTWGDVRLEMQIFFHTIFYIANSFYWGSICSFYIILRCSSTWNIVGSSSYSIIFKGSGLVKLYRLILTYTCNITI